MYLSFVSWCVFVRTRCRSSVRSPTWWSAKLKLPTSSQGVLLFSVGPETYLGVSRKNMRRKMKRWMEKQHLALWRGPCSTQRQARELISGPNLATGAHLLSFNRTQSRVVIGLLTGHNTLRRHLFIMGPSTNLTCRKCGTGEETSVHILCECEALASLRRTYLGSFFLDPEDIRKLGVGAIWNFAEVTGLL
jgi:hypothetical protein